MTDIIGRCATCKHAKSIGDYWITRQHEAGVKYPLFCTRADMEDGNPSDPATLAFAMDASSYHAALLVTPDFGCVMYAPSEQGDETGG